MKVLLVASILAFLSIAAPAVGINPALLATHLSAEEKKSGYKQLFFKKAQHRRLEDTVEEDEDDDSFDVDDTPELEEDDGSFEDYYYVSPLEAISSSCFLTTELTRGLMLQDERFDEDNYYSEDYDSICNSAGGQTVAVTIARSGAECDPPGTSNTPPFCMGATCDQEDIEGYEGLVRFFEEQGQDETCIIEISAVSDGEGDPSQLQLPDIPEDCLDGMTDIFRETIVNEDTGMFNGDTEAIAELTAQCTELGGRMTTISMDYYGGECDEFVDLTSVPYCVSNMCSEDESQEFATAYLSPILFGECEGVKFIVTDEEQQDEDDGSFDEDLTSTVLCPGQLIADYCDCGWDCLEQPSWCSCENAQLCCEGVDEGVTDEMKATKMQKTAKSSKEPKMRKSPKMPKAPKMPK